MRVIDADELIVMEYGGIKFVPVEFINDAPTIDAVPVVRCKDCRYSDDYYNDGGCYCKHPEQGMRCIGTNWNWYCADGERKDDETD